MAIQRTYTYNIGGYDTSKPYNNLMEVRDYDTDTGEITVYPAGTDPPPLPAPEQAEASAKKMKH